MPVLQKLWEFQISISEVISLYTLAQEAKKKKKIHLYVYMHLIDVSQIYYFYQSIGGR